MEAADPLVVAATALPVVGIGVTCAAVLTRRRYLAGGAAAAAVMHLLLSVTNPVLLSVPRLTVFGLAVVVAAAVAMLGSESVRLARTPVVIALQVGIFVAVVTILVVNAPSVGVESQEAFPQNDDDLGGINVHASTLYAARYDNTPAEPNPNCGNGCIPSSAFSEFDSEKFPPGGLDEVGPRYNYADNLTRSKLMVSDPNENDDGPHVVLGGTRADGEATAVDANGETDVVIYSNYSNPRTGSTNHVEITGDYAYADTDGLEYAEDQDNDLVDNYEDNGQIFAVDAYVVEFRSGCLQFDGNAIFGDSLAQAKEGLEKWTGSTGAEAGDGSINDVRTRLGITLDARPILGLNYDDTYADAQTRNVQLSTIQLGATRQVIVDFNLSVGADGRDPYSTANTREDFDNRGQGIIDKNGDEIIPNALGEQEYGQDETAGFGENGDCVGGE